MPHLILDALTIGAVAAAARAWSHRRRRASNDREASLGLVEAGVPAPADRRAVAVFDIGLPPGIAFIRSFAKAGIPVVAYSNERRPVGGFSRHVSEVRTAPNVLHTDCFIDWLTTEMSAGRLDLIAPTSDYLAFNVAVAHDRMGRTDQQGVAGRERLFDCLFKNRFADAMARAGFPTPSTRAPLTLDAAIADAAELGYPVLLKPRSHVGLGIWRGRVVRSERELVRTFSVPRVGPGHDAALAVDPHLAIPLVQQYFAPGRVDVVSISGMLDDEGRVLALTHSRKTHQWPPRLGTGTQFATLPPQPFTDAAVRAVQQVLGRGMFELEVLVDRTSGEYWAIDLNPRGFGQMALDIAYGRDLPRLWYDTAVGVPPEPMSSRVTHNGIAPPTWRLGVPYYAGAVVRAFGGNGRSSNVDGEQRSRRDQRIGPMWDLDDPMPGVVWAAKILRHPGGLVRPYLRDVETINSDSSAVDPISELFDDHPPDRE